jgi:hypothetical protein
MSLTARPATAADVRQFYPTWTCSFRAMVCELNGEVQGIIGIALLRPVACLFSVFNEPLRPFLRHLTVLRLIKWAQGAVKASRVPVLALAEPDEATAPDILTRLGFKHLGTFDDGEIYQWAGA